MTTFGDLYSIRFKSLKTGVHHFNFFLDNRFFEHFENPECQGGAIRIDVEMEKKNHMLSVFMAFSGLARVVCDRCLEEFDLPLVFNSTLFVKFGMEGPESEADIIFLEPDEYKLDLADYFYESACLNLPFRRVHPKDDNGNDLCNKDMIEKLDKYSIRKERTDPRWDSLKELKNKRDNYN
jgi:uncharacterized protein